MISSSQETSVKLVDLNLLDIGTKIGLVGAIFGDNDSTYLCLFPDQDMHHNQKVFEMDLEDWKVFLRQVDLQEMEVLQIGADGNLSKAILRKSQRLIEQRVSWAVFKRDLYRCCYCGLDGIPLTVDHLVLWEEGGPSIEENLITACRKCNKTRGNMQYTDWLGSKYYLKISQNLTESEKADNIALIATLSKIPRRYSRRSTRK
jgi:hypothetical protein